ncbi:fimbrial protein [Burkholderia sp. Ac-20353]|uniref:fimbrial protein n=1 Tax=Burkholderia sp. Ac-20353 TaxID=2703894 RepID=UPI00197BC13F|nr:fimbrial protein [Burkholderia sp. Ac-20353]MBN3787641.1 type 1 fimbrial protein [Burkholderia sp. Ac-20353]
MKIKRLILASAALFAVAATAHAADGTITINGSIVASTCKINGGSGNVTVPLPSLRSTALSSVGAVGGRTPFTLSLTDCTTSDGSPMKVGAYFEPGSSVDLASGRLNADTGADAATGVQINLLNDQQQQIKVGSAGNQNSQLVDIGTDGKATLNYFAEYYASDAVTAGAVNSRVQYSLTYQ